MEIFIYALVDPVTSKVRYVGKTDNPKRRLIEHNSIFDLSKRSVWLKDLKDRGLIPKQIILEICTDRNWPEREIFWIEFFNHGKQLVNNLTGKKRGSNRFILRMRGQEDEEYLEMIKRRGAAKRKRDRSDVMKLVRENYLDKKKVHWDKPLYSKDECQQMLKSAREKLIRLGLR